ncbi:MAG: hypothetical protein V2A58_06665 [Planctomycetota bacterium]
MNWVLLGVLAVVNAPLYWALGKTFFGGWEGFTEALRFYFTPDWWSAMRGEFWEDRWESLKLFVFLVLCVLAVAVEYALIARYFLSAKGS